MSYRLCSLGGGHSGSKHELWQPFSWPDGIGQRPDHLSQLEAGYCSCLRQLRGASQVWPRTQFFFCFLFVKNHQFAWKANWWSRVGERLLSSVPPSNFVSVLDPWRAFISWHGALQGPSTRLVLGFQNYWETRYSQVSCARHGGPQDSFKFSWRKPWFFDLFMTTILDFEESA